MNAPGDPLALLEEVRDLERQLARVRQNLAELADGGTRGELWALEVRCGGQPVLVPVASVREVLPVPMPTPLTEAPPWVLGTFSFAGVTVPMVDLGRRIGGAPTPLAADLRIVVCDRPFWQALVVEEVGRVVRLDPLRLSPPPAELPVAAFVVAHGELADGLQSIVLSPARVAGELDG